VNLLCAEERIFKDGAKVLWVARISLMCKSYCEVAWKWGGVIRTYTGAARSCPDIESMCL